MDPNNSNIDNVMIIMVPRKELICVSKFIQVLPKLISEALDVLRGKIGKSRDINAVFLDDNDDNDDDDVDDDLYIMVYDDNLYIKVHVWM